MAHRTERIVFKGSQGFELAARLDLPAGKPRGYSLFAHCFSCSKDVLTAVRISKALTEHDIALLRFDFTGLGNSQGDFANTNFSSNLEDLRRAAQYLRNHYQAPKLLIGHSLGGSAALAVADDIPEVRGVATLNAPSNPSHISHFFQDSLAEIAVQGEAEVLLAGRKFRIQQQFLHDLTEQRLLDKVAQLPCPLLIMHSPVDAIVNIEHAMHIFNAAKYPKSFLSLDDADHMVSRPQDAAFVAAVLSAWADRFLDPL
jgi:putative redox protein